MKQKEGGEVGVPILNHFLSQSGDFWIAGGQSRDWDLLDFL